MSILKMADRLLELQSVLQCYCKLQHKMHNPDDKRCRATMHDEAGGFVYDGENVAKHYLRAVELLDWAYKEINTCESTSHDKKALNPIKEFLKEAEGERGE